MPPADQPVPWTDGISRLTVEALEAAERGQWDRVEACYRERETWFRHNHVSSNLAQALLAMDTAVLERVTVAHAAVGQALFQAVNVHKQWRTIAGATGEVAPVGGRLNWRT